MKIVIGFLGIMVLLGCAAGTKTVAPTAESEQLEAMVKTQNFRLEMDWAEPLMTNSMVQVMNSGLFPPGNALSRINIQGNGNFIAMQGDSVEADLPYFGERQMGGGYGANEGIKFKGLAQKLKIVKNEKRQSHQIAFTINEKSETFQVRIYLLPSGTARVRITSSERFSIGYEGRVNESYFIENQ